MKTITISSDGSAVSGKPHLPSGWACVLEWTEPGTEPDEADRASVRKTLVAAGCCPRSDFGVIGTELRGMVLGVQAAYELFGHPLTDLKDIRLDLKTDSSHLDRMVRGSNPRKGGHNKGPWKVFDVLAPLFGEVHMSWWPRNSSGNMEAADLMAGYARKRMVARLDGDPDPEDIRTERFLFDKRDSRLHPWTTRFPNGKPWNAEDTKTFLEAFIQS